MFQKLVDRVRTYKTRRLNKEIEVLINDYNAFIKVRDYKMAQVTRLLSRVNEEASLLGDSLKQLQTIKG